MSLSEIDRPLFEAPAPIPRTVPPSVLTIIRTVMRNPLELWGEPSYTLPYIQTRFFRERTLIVNHPGLIRHVMVERADNYKMAEIRQLVLRPILRDGLLTAEGDVWKRSRKAMAPVFAPRHAFGFAGQMAGETRQFLDRYQRMGEEGGISDIAIDMTELTYAILSQTLFSGDIAAETNDFAEDVNELLHRMGRVDPADLLRLPSWVPRLLRIGSGKVMDRFRAIVFNTMARRRKAMEEKPDAVPQDFLTHLLSLEREDGLTHDEIADNLLTFIGAGHETTARALAWTLFCLAHSPEFRQRMESEIAEVLASGADPVDWLDLMPHVRAAFEEGMRLYPPAPSINREAIADDSWISPEGEEVPIAAGTTVLIMPWTLHRHQLYWDRPRHYIPERFLPENRDSIHRFQYLPFGAGPRICIGATFALQEAVIALALLMDNFRFDTVSETRPWPVQKLTTQPGGGLPMRVTPRKRPASVPSAA